MPIFLYNFVEKNSLKMTYVFEGDTDPWSYTISGIFSYFLLSLSFIPLPIVVVMDSSKAFYALAMENDADLMAYNAYDDEIRGCSV